MGGYGEHVDPEQGRLIQQLIAETCKVQRSHDEKVAPVKVIRENLITILDLHPNRHDEGIIADIKFEGRLRDFTYNPATAMTYCGSYTPQIDGFIKYDNISKTLVDKGGNPEIYAERLAAHRENRHITKFINLPDHLFQTVHDVYLQWDDIGDRIPGTMRVMKDMTEQITATLPNSREYCTGKTFFVDHPGHDSYHWRLSCTNGRSAKGAFSRLPRSDSYFAFGKDDRGGVVWFFLQEVPADQDTLKRREQTALNSGA